MSAEREPSFDLKLLCFRAVRTHFFALGERAVAVLPRGLLEELQPHLTVYQLDHLQSALNSRGVSTFSAWRSILRDIRGPAHVLEVKSEGEAKTQVMNALFPSVLYNYKSDFIRRNLSNLNTVQFLCAAARSVSFFIVRNQAEALRRLTEEQRLVLDLLERHVTSVGVYKSLDPRKAENLLALLVLHRLLDHGLTRRVLFKARCPHTLAWILHERGPHTRDMSDGKTLETSALCLGRSSCSVEEQGPLCKRPRLELRAGVSCPRRHIQSLELRQCEQDCLRVLLQALPSWSCLRSLALENTTLWDSSAVEELIQALQRLSSDPGGGLTELTVSPLSSASLLEELLEACPRLLSCSVEVQNITGLSETQVPPGPQNHHPFLLQKLSVSLNQQLSPGLQLSSLLQRCPQLSSLHVSGLRLRSGASHGQLLNTLTECCRSLSRLHLEDMNLSDCLLDVLQLLSRCQLQELQLKDCRLLEKWSNKEKSLHRLSTALSEHKTLNTLSLAHNRIARHVPVLAQLFSDDPHSALQHLDLSSNFIQPGELLEFSQRLQVLRPSRRITLDLRKNPGDRDTHTWSLALSSLAPFCRLLVEDWTSTNTMADHISNM
ncbi:hypothetical protein WMY93_024566 [Mugilogobius chulae]|uniref:Leucine-rich repeat-containing protein 41 n=1 Tax=Mugilogobius chulae TaxID=88201 RepID=A0AAW0N6S7_9GOBI